MVTFTLETGSIVTLRASGTEPKIKYYIELRTEPGKTEALVNGKYGKKMQKN
jgi:phosphomannomutase